MTVVRFPAGQVRRIDGIQPTHQMACHELFPALRAKKAGGVFSGE